MVILGKRRGLMLAVLLLSWLLGLALFFPHGHLESWARAGSRGQLAWSGLELGWTQVKIRELRFLRPPMPPAYDVREVRVSANPFSLLLGGLSTEFALELDAARLAGTAHVRPGASTVDWRLDVSDLKPLTLVPGWPEGGIAGSGAGEGAVTVDWIGQSLLSGAGKMVLNGIAFMGVEIPTLTLKGTVPEKNRVVVRVSGQGNVAVSGSLTLQILPGRLGDSRLTGTLQVQPLKSRLAGVAGALLAGRRIALVFSGVLSNPRWRIR